MYSPNGRILKEARALFWPWCAVVFAAVTQWLPFPPGARFPLPELGLLGLWIGFPLLAALSVGNEFHHRTLGLLLSQPVDRRRIWAEKWIVLLVAELSAVVVYWMGRQPAIPDDLQLGFLISLAIVSVLSAMFWTLVAGSIIGGLALNAFQLGAIVIGGQLTLSLLGPTPSQNALTAAFAIGGAAVLGYALLMFWLGRGRLASFQATGEVAGNDLSTTSPSALRSRPTGALANLIRKELRLLWPVWLLTSFTILFLACMAPFRFVNQPGDSVSAVASGVALLAVVLAALLSGSLSLGEERSLGIHSWHMTLPVSARRHWLTKLLVASLTSVLCTAIVVSAGRLLIGPVLTARVFETFGTHSWTQPLFLLILGSSLLSFAAFWCSCAVKGTIRAVLWVFPTVGMGLFVYRLGLAIGFAPHSPTTVSLPAWVLDFAVSQLHPFPFASSTENVLFRILSGPFAAISLAVPLLLVTLFQSYRDFRTEARDSPFSMIRRLLPPLAVIVLCAFLWGLPFQIVHTASFQAWSVLGEASRAIDKMRIDPAKLDAARPFELTLEDLAKAAPLSDVARSWIGNTTITVTPREITRQRFKNRQFTTETFQYFSTVHLRNNWDCSVYGNDFFVYFCTSPTGSWGYPKFP